MGNDEEPSLKESYDTLAEVMAESPALRVLLSTGLPYIGPALAELISGRGQEIIESRRASFIQLIADYLRDIDEQTIKKDYFTTPEGFDLLVKAIEEAQKTRSEAKRDLYARILAGAVRNSQYQGYPVEEYLHLVADLTPQELSVARSLYEERPQTSDEHWEPWMQKVCADQSIDRDDLPMILSRLESRGLVRRVVAREDDGGLWIQTGDPGYEATVSFHKLMRFIERAYKGGASG